MYEYGYPILFALFVWWFSTGVILYLDGLPRRTFRWSMLGATVLLAVSLYGLAKTANDTGIAGAYRAFTFGVLAWGWHEISFYMGVVTGPRKSACPMSCRGWRRFGYAIQTILYHELAIIVSAAVILWLTWGGANQVGTWTFMVLWSMRQSAKLNVFFGVRNLNEEFLPEHLDYLKSFLTRKPMNLFFPISVTVSTAIAVWLIQLAIAPGATAFDKAGQTFVATLLVLAILEHWFLVLPLPAGALWSWGLRSREAVQPFDPAIAGGAATRADDGGQPIARDPHGELGLGLTSWSTALTAPCDPKGLKDLLESVARGAFGDVDRVKGIVPAGAGWVRFDVAGGRASMTAFAPSGNETARVIAIGRTVDETGLEAAFAACADPMSA